MSQYYDFDFSTIPQLDQIKTKKSSMNKKYEISFHYNKKVFTCLANGCGKTFKFKSEIKRHVAIHSNERPFVCPFCNKSFKRADALGNHTKIHDKNTTYTCTVPNCDAIFQTRPSLQYHLLKHNDEKIFKCVYPGCTKSFITFAQLKQHQKASTYHSKLADTSSPSQTDSSTRIEELYSSSERKDQIEDTTIQEENHYDMGDFFHKSIDSFINKEELESVPSQDSDFSNIFLNRNLSNHYQANTDLNFSSFQANSAMDTNFINMIQAILRENECLKRQLDSAASLLQENSIETHQCYLNDDVDKFFYPSLELGENDPGFPPENF